jgi:hypothetical protein
MSKMKHLGLMMGLSAMMLGGVHSNGVIPNLVDPPGRRKEPGLPPIEDRIKAFYKDLEPEKPSDKAF